MVFAFASPATAAADEPPAVEAAPGVVEAVVEALSFEGDADADPVQLQKAADLRPGDPLARGRVQRALRELYRTGGYETVSAWAVPEGKGVRLVFRLAPLKRVGALRFAGNALLGETALGQASGLAIGADWHPERGARAVAAIRAAYHRLGHRDAAVEVETLPLPGNDVVAAFTIDEREPTRVAKVSFAGDGAVGAAAPSADGARALGPGEAEQLLGLGPGSVLDLEELERGVRRLRDRLRALGRFRARVGEPQISALPDGARISLQVEPGPAIRFDFRGNRTFSDEVLRGELDYRGEDPLDDPLLQDLGRKLRDFYVGAGFLNAKVTAREFAEGKERSLAVFAIDEGQPVRVAALRFEGNVFVPTPELVARLESKLVDRIEPDPEGGTDPALVEAAGVAGRPLGSGAEPHFHVRPADVFSPTLYRQAIAGIVDLYKSQGFLDVSVEPPRIVELDGKGGGRLEVTIAVNEGPRTLVEAVELRGCREVSEAEARAVLKLRAGDPFSYLRVEEARGAIVALYAKLGWLTARVEEETRFDDAGGGGRRATVRYLVTEGPQVRAGRVHLRGLRRTQPFVVLDALGLREGEVLTSERLAQAQSALQRLGIFSSATLRVVDPELPEAVKDVVVQVREKAPTAWELALGLSTVDGPRAMVQYTEHNLGGRNINFNSTAKLNFPIVREVIGCVGGACGDEGVFPVEGRVDLGLQYPRIYGFPLGARTDLALQRVLRPRYFLQKAGAVAGLDYHASRELAVALQGELEFDSSEGSDPTIPQNLRLPEGDMVLASLRPSIVVDLRDDPSRPRSGFFASLSGDLVHSFFARDRSGPFAVELIKVAAQASGYFSLPEVPWLRGWVVALSVSGGTIWTLAPPAARPLTPAHKRFFLGGSGSLRGFSEDAVVAEDVRRRLAGEIEACQAIPHFCPAELAAIALQGRPAPSAGGQTYLVGKAELRFPTPLSESLEGALFVDAGNLWLDPSQVRFFVTDASGESDTGLRWTAGAGLRYLTPIGPLALDVGWLLDRDDLVHEKAFSLHFSIGLF